MEQQKQSPIPVSGVICEFNPLHLGHKLLLDHARAIGPVVCAMSGNFVQRGEPAIMDKWSRTRMALLCGADLVVELPLPLATGGAQTFARGGVALLTALGVSHLCFGSESGNINALQAIVQHLSNPAFIPLLQEQLALGCTFAAAREQAVKRLLTTTYKGELALPNNNLALEYLAAMPAHMQAYTVKRQGGGHDQTTATALCSAMQVRGLMQSGQDFAQHLPQQSLSIIHQQLENGLCPASFAPIERAVLAVLRTLPPSALAQLPDLSEGIENKLYTAVRKACSLDALYCMIKSKRYSHARVRRLVLHAFLGVTKNMQCLRYIRVLGMNATGEKILRKAAKNGLPIVGKTADIAGLTPEAQQQFDVQCRATDLYALAMPTAQPTGMEHTQKLIRL